MYDYGAAGNLIHYNQSTPPQYSLSNLPTTLPIALFSGGNDYLGIVFFYSTHLSLSLHSIYLTQPCILIFFLPLSTLADPIDVQKLVSLLPTPPVLHHIEPTFSHVDFLWAEDASKNIYPLILQLVQKYSTS